MIRRIDLSQAAACTLSLAAVCACLWYFHDRFWWPVDEGVYAYVAQRILAGDRLHLDLVDLHGGYGNLANALAFVLFGQDLLSLRYPLSVLTLIQCGLIYWLIKDRGPWIAATGVLAAGVFSFIQFLNPSANWYALFLCIATIDIAARIEVSTRRGLILLGFFLGLCFLTRQLSGVILAAGTLTWLMMRRSNSDGRRVLGGRIFTAFLGIGVGGYLLSKGSASAVALVGLWPLWVIGLAYLRVNLDSAEVGRILGWLSVGAGAAALPLFIYHAANGALTAWLNDIFIVALQIHGQDFVDQYDYFFLVSTALETLLSPSSVAGLLSSVGWIVAVMIIPVTGYLCASYVRDSGQSTALDPLCVIAPFWALVSVHYEIPIYLFFALPVIVPTFLTQVPRRPAIILVLLLSTWAVVFQAGQPLSRGYLGTVEGQRVELGPRADLSRVSLRIEPEDREVFDEVIRHIQATARAGEMLMTLPMDPELNFMTGQKSPVRYYGTPLGLRTAADVEATLERLKAAAPLFVVHRRQDKYLTPLSAQLLKEIQTVSPAPESIGPFDLYRFPGLDSDALSPRPDRE